MMKNYKIDKVGELILTQTKPIKPVNTKPKQRTVSERERRILENLFKR